MYLMKILILYPSLHLIPMFKAEFNGFYMVGGPSVGIKLAGSGEFTRTVTGKQPSISPLKWKLQFTKV